MQIEGHFERREPKNEMSAIIYRGLTFETRLKPECVKKIASKNGYMPDYAIQIIGVFAGVTRFRVSLDAAKAGNDFPRFMYDVMNWEGNTHHSNR